MSIIDSRRLSFNEGRCVSAVTVWGYMLFRLVFGEFFGPDRCKLALVAPKKVELATFSREGGRARRKRCDRGSCWVGGES